MELFAAALAVLVVLACLIWRAPAATPMSRWAIAAGFLVVAAAAVALRPREEVESPVVRQVPERVREEGFVSSQACRACHPSEWASWQQSFHRSMTQVATKDNILADFDEQVLEARGRTYRLERRGDEAWVSMVDPAYDLATLRGRGLGAAVYEEPAALDLGVLPHASDLVGPGEPQIVSKRIVMSTGSHNQQTYWVGLGEDDRTLFQFPWSWIIDEKRWIPREDAFLQPPSEDRTPVVWNASCVKCHSVGARPELNHFTQTMDTKVAELGIACEACHGPGEEHIRVNQSPVRRYRRHFTEAGDDTVVNPDKLVPKRSAMVCGQCHSFQERIDGRGWWEHGDLYRAGDDLEITRRIMRPPSNGLPSPHMYWADGTYKAGGREYNGLIESACYTRGDMTCLSCHSIHESDPVDQLRRDAPNDEACLVCHSDFRERITEHSRHAAGSEGASCVNCHMPHTAYALFKAIRSHRVDSPDAVSSSRFGRPTACELCHLDRSLGWTASKLSEWYGLPEPDLSDDQRRVATGVRLALEGDASKRVFAAWHMGWPPARAAAGDDWMVPYLAQLLEDPYVAVRKVAHRSLRTYPGFAATDYDFLASATERAAVIASVRADWARGMHSAEAKPAVLVDAGGAIDTAEYERLLARRDNTEVIINE